MSVYERRFRNCSSPRIKGQNKAEQMEGEENIILPPRAQACITHYGYNSSNITSLQLHHKNTISYCFRPLIRTPTCSTYFAVTAAGAHLRLTTEGVQGSPEAHITALVDSSHTMTILIATEKDAHVYTQPVHRYRPWGLLGSNGPSPRIMV